MNSLKIQTIRKPVIEVSEDGVCIFLRLNNLQVESIEERYDGEVLILAHYSKNKELVGLEITNYLEVKEWFCNYIFDLAKIEAGDFNYKELSWTIKKI